MIPPISWTELRIAPDWTLRLAAGSGGLLRLETNPQSPATQTPGNRDDSHPVLREAVRQLEAYFDRRLRQFDLPLDLHGTPFQLQVWNLLLQIPYGRVRTYRDLALDLGKPGAARAVGTANGNNPIGIIVPCHRVLASNRGLGGYSAGLEFKRRLLALEGHQVQQSFRIVDLDPDLKPEQR